MCKYSIVIPCYSSARWLEELVQRIAEVMRSRDEPFEIVLVNDASPDNTWEVAERLAQQHDFVTSIDLLFNTGQHRTTVCGLTHAQGEYVILMDDDLQHPPEEIPKLIQAMQSESAPDCVMGIYEKKKHGLIRNLGSRVWGYIAAKLYRMPTNIRLSSFRIMNREIAQALCLHGTANPVVGPLIFRSTRRIGNVQVRHSPRTEGKSGYSYPRLIKIVLDNVFSASTIPLKAVSLFGLICAVLSFLLSCYYLVQYFLNRISVPGYTSQILLIAFFGGSILFSIGLVGEYLIRIIDEVRRPPRYVVRQVAGANVERPQTAHSAPEGDACG